MLIEKSRRIKAKKKVKKSWNGLPATVKWTIAEPSLYESFAASIIWHIVGLLLICLLTFLITFFGLAPKIFPKAQPKMHDIEFVLNNHTRHRIHHRKIKATPSTVDADSQAAPKSDNTNKISSSIPKASNEKQSSMPSKTNVSNRSNSKSSGAHSKSTVPDFAIPMSSLKSMSSGLGGSGKSHRASGVNSSSSSIGGSDGGSSAGKGTSGHSGFDKNTTRKMIAPYDISPYVNELKRNVRWNWKAPKGNGNKRVELFLRIAKDGRVVILNVKRTSESGEVDNAALNAVRKCMPLSPIPTKYSKSYLDLILTFDANSISSRY